MPLKHIQLELARDHEFPSGSRERGYEFVAPLDDDGHLVAKEWQTARERCRVKRVWADEPAELGHLVHRPGGGLGPSTTMPRAHPTTSRGSSSTSTVLFPGEYVSFREHDGTMRTDRE